MIKSYSKIVNESFDGYVKRLTESGPSDVNFEHMQDVFYDECIDGIEPLYEGTEAGEYVLSLCSEVEEQLNLSTGPSIQMGMEDMFIVAEDGATAIVDPEEFNYWLSNLFEESQDKQAWS